MRELGGGGGGMRVIGGGGVGVSWVGKGREGGGGILHGVHVLEAGG